jgi:hypothetical protein
MNRAELDLVTADVEATEKLTAAKEAYRDKPTLGNKQKLAEAKRAVFELRQHWRGIGEAVGTRAAVSTVNTKSRSN